MDGKGFGFMKKVMKDFVKTILAALAIGIAVINVIDNVQKYVEIKGREN